MIPWYPPCREGIVFVCCSRWGPKAIDVLHTPAGQLRQRQNTKPDSSNHSFNNILSKRYLCSGILHDDRLPHLYSASINMAPPTDRKEILAGFRKQIESGTAIVGAGAGMEDRHRVTQGLST